MGNFVGPNALALRFAWPRGDTTPPTPRPGEAPTPRWTDRAPMRPDQGFPAARYGVYASVPPRHRAGCPRAWRGVPGGRACLQRLGSPRGSPGDGPETPRSSHQAHHAPGRASPVVWHACGPHSRQYGRRGTSARDDPRAHQHLPTDGTPCGRSVPPRAHTPSASPDTLGPPPAVAQARHGRRPAPRRGGDGRAQRTGPPAWWARAHGGASAAESR